MNQERFKWTTENPPKGYPGKCSKKLLREVIQDLYEELDKKTRQGKSNEFWRFLILNHIQSGNNELQYRNNSLVSWVTLGGIIISLIALTVSFLSFNSSSSWEDRQLKSLEEQKSIQSQILEVIKQNIPAK